MIIYKTKMKRAPDPDNSIRVGSVRTLLDALEKMQLDSSKVLFFRGHQSHTFEIKPSIYRDDGWIANEDILFKELILRCPNEFAGMASTFQMLVKMQHYSLPTRLLDVTLNPLIALFFACIDAENGESGEVVPFSVPTREIKYFDSDTVSVISNLSRRPKKFEVGQGDSVSDFNKSQQGKLLLHEIRQEKPYFEPKIEPQHLRSAVFVKPKLENARILRQDGAFLLFGISGHKMQPAEISPSYLAYPEKKRIIITDKKKVRSQLESLGVTQGSIFPEIDKVAEYIRAKFRSSID